MTILSLLTKGESSFVVISGVAVSTGFSSAVLITESLFNPVSVPISLFKASTFPCSIPVSRECSE